MTRDEVWPTMDLVGAERRAAVFWSMGRRGPATYARHPDAALPPAERREIG
jgi:hypothetical protein